MRLDEETRARHPNLESTKRMLRLQRSLHMPRDPRHINDIIIEGE